MDKFSAISLFDFFSFLIPGFLLEASVYFCYKLSNISLLHDFPLFFKREVILFILLSIVAYLIGHVIHYISQGIRWLGAGEVKRSINSRTFLNKESYLITKLNEKCKQYFEYSMIDDEGKLLDKETDRFFETSFRLLENQGILQTSRNLQVQFVLFVNVYTTLLISAVLGLGTIIYVIFTSGDKSSIKYLFIFSAITASFASLCYSIASQRRKLFIKTIWWQFFSFYIYPTIKPDNYGLHPK